MWHPDPFGLTPFESLKSATLRHSDTLAVRFIHVHEGATQLTMTSSYHSMLYKLGFLRGSHKIVNKSYSRMHMSPKCIGPIKSSGSEANLVVYGMVFITAIFSS
jgi:hypothetical protein